MTFAPPDAEPTLFAQEKNAIKALRDYARTAIGHYAAQGHRQYLARFSETNIELPTADDPSLNGFIVVPVNLVPQWDMAHNI